MPNSGCVTFLEAHHGIRRLYLLQSLEFVAIHFKGSSPSCASTNGGTNDLGTAPQMCKDDPTSIRLETSQGKAECLVATLVDCKIPIHDFVSLDYDFHVADCLGFWGCPLWMTPDVWQWGKCSFLGIYHCLIICLTTFCTTL